MTDRIIRIKVDSSGATRGINQVDSQMQRLGGTTDRIQTQLTRVAQAIATAFSVRQIVAYADEFTNVQNKLRVVTNGTQELAAATSNLLQIANETRSSFDATADLYSKLARSTEELGVSNERLLAITTTINKSFAVAGASAQEASNAIRQLGQGLAAGALRGDEFNSVAEQAPGILRAVSAETGKTIGELREFAAEGGITAELLIRSIENYADTVDREFAKTNRTFEQSAQEARNNAVAFVGSSELIQNATEAAGNTLVTLSNNLETVGEVLTFVAAIVAGRWLGALSASSVALINKSRAALSAKVQTDALGVAIARTSTAAAAGAVAARGLTAAFATLGGPIGVITIAASALLLFANNSDDAENAAADLDGEINKLTESYKKLSQQAFSNTALQLQKEAVSIDQQLAEKKSQLASATKDAVGELDILGGQVKTVGTDTAKLRREIAELEKKQADLAPKIAAVNQVFEDGLPSVQDYTDATKQTNVQLDDLNNNFSLLRKVGAEIDKIFTGELNLFGDESGSGQSDEAAARINSRIEALKLETQTIASETALQQAVRQGFLTQEQADLDLQTATKIQKAITERELLLAEKNITDEQIAAAEAAFQEQLTAISAQQAEQRLQVRRAEFSQQIGLYQNYANAALALGEAFGSKSEKANKKRRRVGVIIDTAAGIGRAFAENNFYTALGISALIAANGAAQLSAINSASSGGGGSISSSGAGVPALPTQPQSAQQVQALEITGLGELVDELRQQDGVVSTVFVANLLDKVQSANRLRGEG